MGKTSVITIGRCCELFSVPQYTYPAADVSPEGGQAVNKAIFLDVDGVLNDGNWAMEMYQQGVRVYHDDLLYLPKRSLYRSKDRREAGSSFRTL